MSTGPVVPRIDITPFASKISDAEEHLVSLKKLVNKDTGAVADAALKGLVAALEEAVSIGSPITLDPAQRQAAVGIKIGLFNTRAKALCGKITILDADSKVKIDGIITTFKKYINGLRGIQDQEKEKVSAATESSAASRAVKKGLEEPIRPGLTVLDNTRASIRIEVSWVNMEAMKAAQSRSRLIVYDPSKASYEVRIDGRQVGNFIGSKSLVFDHTEKGDVIKITETEVGQLQVIPTVHYFDMKSWAMMLEPEPAPLPSATPLPMTQPGGSKSAPNTPYITRVALADRPPASPSNHTVRVNA